MKYCIIGNGGFAKEVLFLCKEKFGHLNDFEGFIDYQPVSKTIHCLGKDFPVLDENEFLRKKDFTKNLYIGVGWPATVKKIARKFVGYNFPNIEHPNVVRDTSVSFGQGNVVTAGCIFTVDIQIGSFNVFNLHTSIGHDVQIGDFNVFNPGSNVSGGVIIGSTNLFGTNSTVLQGIEIQNDSIIGAASLVNKNVFDNETVVGVPAKKLLK